MESFGPVTSKPGRGKLSKNEKDDIIARARKANEERLKGYREQSLRIHPWVCARCGREFTNKNIHLLTVHHKDHNHDNNPPDGSNWENLCVYCHDNEHSRYLDHSSGGSETIFEEQKDSVTYNPFAGLADMLKEKEGKK
jgi:hypothetical protein